jgi:hypothetical protein
MGDGARRRTEAVVSDQFSVLSKRREKQEKLISFATLAAAKRTSSQ